MAKLKQSDPTPIRIPVKLLREIDAASSEIEMSKQETIRIAIRVGLERLRRVNYDLAGSVNDAAEKKEEKPAKSRAA